MGRFSCGTIRCINLSNIHLVRNPLKNDISVGCLVRTIRVALNKRTIEFDHNDTFFNFNFKSLKIKDFKNLKINL
ncbi:hypothetical protein BLOT_009234 [Blomia tropicalis]|nr:hypothetical protein BLOT_009234 [Blomia tropicalis]